jgi:hypothetical protein
MGGESRFNDQKFGCAIMDTQSIVTERGHGLVPPSAQAMSKSHEAQDNIANYNTNTAQAQENDSLIKGESLPSAVDEEIDVDQFIAWLAALSIIEYDRERKDATVRLGIKVSTLDSLVSNARKVNCGEDTALFPKVEPWPDPVSGKSVKCAL